MVKPIPALSRNCFECRYADQMPGQPSAMICRRFPPTTITLPNGSMGTWHPVVSPGDWCFEYSAALRLSS